MIKPLLAVRMPSAGVGYAGNPQRGAMMIRYLAIAIILLAGCVSPEQAAYNRQQQAQQEQYQREAYRERLLSNCDRMGFQRGTDAHANCVLSQYQQNQQQLMQLIQQQQQQRVVPRCSSLPPGIAGYEASAGRCY